MSCHMSTPTWSSPMNLPTSVQACVWAVTDDCSKHFLRNCMRTHMRENRQHATCTNIHNQAFITMSSYRLVQQYTTFAEVLKTGAVIPLHKSIYSVVWRKSIGCWEKHKPELIYRLYIMSVDNRQKTKIVEFQHELINFFFFFFPLVYHV